MTELYFSTITKLNSLVEKGDISAFQPLDMAHFSSDRYNFIRRYTINFKGPSITILTLQKYYKIITSKSKRLFEYRHTSGHTPDCRGSVPGWYIHFCLQYKILTRCNPHPDSQSGDTVGFFPGTNWLGVGGCESVPWHPSDSEVWKAWSLCLHANIFSCDVFLNWMQEGLKCLLWEEFLTEHLPTCKVTVFTKCLTSLAMRGC
jgi:hypothetical protein